MNGPDDDDKFGELSIHDTNINGENPIIYEEVPETANIIDIVKRKIYRIGDFVRRGVSFTPQFGYYHDFLLISNAADDNFHIERTQHNSKIDTYFENNGAREGVFYGEGSEKIRSINVDKYLSFFLLFLHDSINRKGVGDIKNPTEAKIFILLQTPDLTLIECERRLNFLNKPYSPIAKRNAPKQCQNQLNLHIQQLLTQWDENFTIDVFDTNFGEPIKTSDNAEIQIKKFCQFISTKKTLEEQLELLNGADKNRLVEFLGENQTNFVNHRTFMKMQQFEKYANITSDTKGEIDADGIDFETSMIYSLFPQLFESKTDIRNQLSHARDEIRSLPDIDLRKSSPASRSLSLLSQSSPSPSQSARRSSVSSPLPQTFTSQPLLRSRSRSRSRSSSQSPSQSPSSSSSQSQSQSPPSSPKLAKDINAIFEDKSSYNSMRKFIFAIILSLMSIYSLTRGHAFKYIEAFLKKSPDENVEDDIGDFHSSDLDDDAINLQSKTWYESNKQKILLVVLALTTIYGFSKSQAWSFVKEKIQQRSIATAKRQSSIRQSSIRQSSSRQSSSRQSSKRQSSSRQSSSRQPSKRQPFNSNMRQPMRIDLKQIKKLKAK